MIETSYAIFPRRFREVPGKSSLEHSQCVSPCLGLCVCVSGSPTLYQYTCCQRESEVQSLLKWWNRNSRVTIMDFSHLPLRLFYWAQCHLHILWTIKTFKTGIDPICFLLKNKKVSSFYKQSLEEGSPENFGEDAEQGWAVLEPRDLSTLTCLQFY